MIIYPAVDLIGGEAVRLQQGRFNDVTRYPIVPSEALRQFADAGATWAHVVDLDGARAGRPMQCELIAKLAREAPLRVQAAGGYREGEQLERMFDAGVARIMVGSLAVRQPEMVRSWIDEFGSDRIGLSLDVRVNDGIPLVAVAGWTEDSGKSLWDVAADFPQARHLLVTDIGRDGMLGGPNVALYNKIVRRLPHVDVQASGGVSSLSDLERLPTAGAIIGKALWEGRVSLTEALNLARA